MRTKTSMVRQAENRRVVLHLCLVILLTSFHLFSASVEDADPSSPIVDAWLSKPLITDDGRVYTCSGKNLFSFDSNSTVLWILPLGYLCNVENSPVVDDRGKMYMIAEERILKVTPSHIGTSKPASEVIFGPNSTTGGSGEILGLSISIFYSSLLVSIKTRGLFALSLNGELLWSVGPILYRFGYRQGCKENFRDCYFSSAPVVDQCEGTLYISNTEGQLYSLYLRSHSFRWIKDFVFIDKLFTVIPGNNGLLYVLFPKKATVIALDVHTGNASWQQNFGPLSTEQALPVVDSNGWLSIGSLDGYLYSFSPTGEVKKLLHATASNSVIHASPVLDCSGFAVYVLQTMMTGKSSLDIGNYTYISAMNPTSVVVTMLTPATGTVYWTGNYPGELSNSLSGSNLSYFKLDERIFLTFQSSSRSGYTLPCHTMSQKVAWTCSQGKHKFISMYTENEGAFLPLIFFQLAVLLLLACFVCYCFIFWRKKKLQNHGLVRFLNKRKSLHQKRKTLGRMITKLERRAAEYMDSPHALEQLGEMVKAKEGIERQLSTSYSLGRDNYSSRQGPVLPLSHGKKAKSHSFHSATNECVTIFNTLGSSESGNSSDVSSEGAENWLCMRVAEEPVGKGKSVVVESSSPSRTSGSPESSSSLRFSENPRMQWSNNLKPKRKGWLKRRTLSSTN